MTVSSSTDFSLSASDIITAARGKLGISAQEETLEAADLQSGLKALNMMLKAWQADEVMCWTMTEQTFALAQGDTTVTFGAGMDVTTVPFDITAIQINRGSNDLPMFRMSRQQYRELPNKTNQGYPTQFYYDRQRDTGTLYIWPAADSTAGTLKMDTRRIIMDLDASGNTFDLPQEWYEALVYNLAVRLGPDYGQTASPDFAEVKAMAGSTYEIVKSFDAAEGESSIMVLPYGAEY